jgi:hypothetical protein
MAYYVLVYDGTTDVRTAREVTEADVEKMKKAGVIVYTEKPRG